MARSVDILETPVEYLKGVGPVRADVLKKELDVFTFADLLEYFPFRYVDRSKFYSIKDIRDDVTYIQLKGTLVHIQKIGSHRATRLVGLFQDGTESIELVWFRGIKWIEKKLVPGTEYIVFGKPNYYKGKYNLPHPEIDPATEPAAGITEKLQPFYPSTEKLKSKGLDSKGIRKILKTLLIQVKGHIPETLSKHLIDKLRLMSREPSLLQVHFPENQQILEKARARLKFEELFFIQLQLLRMKLIRMEKISGHRFDHVGNHFNNFYSKYLPFPLTGAQKKVIRDIRKDLGSGKQMNRLLQGDVGSGKTLVALMSALIALDNGFQACLMAPTEILANQHYNTVRTMTSGMDIEVDLLTGSTKNTVRKQLFQALSDGKLHLLIGTHALLEENVRFSNLGFVVIDEQHRFGVAQRARLWKKNEIPPHVLVMTATPIPRTLAMTFYGDLDVSVIDELPPGRKPVKTVHFYDRDRLKLFGFLKKMIEQGRQAYIVYPLIRESEKLDLKDLQDGYDSISRAFPLPEYAISIVHGQMPTRDKAWEMERFVKGETDIMVSTTVIEVGVDVPNASVMVIENAERFGLSQLHQLRGRVGRGAAQSYCILMSKDKLTTDGRKRIQTMVRTTDGFEIAEADLRLRGPGDLQGTQQSGLLGLKISDIIKDEKMLKYARSEAGHLLEQDPHLQNPENKPIINRLRSLRGIQADWSQIS